MNPPPAAPTMAAPAPALAPYRTPKAGVGRVQSLRRQRITVGILLLAIGVLVTFGTYALAASSPSGGTYFIAFGPAIVGVYEIARGLGTPADTPAGARRKHGGLPPPRP